MLNLATDRLDGWGSDTGSGAVAAAQQTRERLVEAAFATVRELGASGLTLEAVARQAGVSKGGLLHHFRSKDALVEAALGQLLAGFAARVEELAEAEPPGAGRWCRAYVRASYAEGPIPLELGMLLLRSITDSPALAALLHADGERWRRRLADDGLPEARAALVRQAADAAWLEQMMDPGMDAALRSRVEQELLALTWPGTA